MKDTGDLGCHDEPFLGYLRRLAGYVQDESSLKDRKNNKDEQEQDVVCWQLTLGREFYHFQRRWIDGSHAV
jgi:hypothetical protein